MTHLFTSDDLLLANYRLSLENNAMLQLSIHNQALIMQKLGIPIGINSALMKTLLPKEYKAPNPDPEVSEMLRLPALIKDLTEKQVFEEIMEINRAKNEIKTLGPDMGLDVDQTANKTLS